MRRPKFSRELALSAFRDSGALRRLEDHPAVVLERLARAAGATRWYYVDDVQAALALASEVRPNSLVTFFFDDRISEAEPGPDTLAAISEVIRQTGDAVVGWLMSGSPEIKVDFPSGKNELLEVLSAMPTSARLFFGPFPSHETDAGAMLVRMPDGDGLLRDHPH